MSHKEALEILKLGNNVFLTGAAGSGKTYLLNKYIKFLRSHNVEVGITASTGIAATHMDGITIDSWSGAGIRESLTDKDINELFHKHYLRNRISKTKVLIIDEISMLPAYKLNMVDQICRLFKDNQKPFGGMQVVFCGDFFQLPPIGEDRGKPQFAFYAKTWKDLNLKICYLTEQYRQKNDPLLQILNAMRNNQLNEEMIRLLQQTFNQNLNRKIIPTKLYTHNVDVDDINSSELEKIKSEPHYFDMVAVGRENIVTAMKKSCLAPERLVLKKNALVMFVRNNYQEGYVNGTTGKITGFNRDGYPVVEITDGTKISAVPVNWTILEEGLIKAQLTQVPLRLAWAITVHKSQGMTLDCAEIDLSKSFVTGMGYVALSRVKSIKGLRLLGLNNLALQVNQLISQTDHYLLESSISEEENLKNMGFWKRFFGKRQFMYYLTTEN